MHPVLKEPRTGSLLTTYGNHFHVQFHNSDLGVYVLQDTELTPIGLNDFYRQDFEVLKKQMHIVNQQKLQLI